MEQQSQGQGTQSQAAVSGDLLEQIIDATQAVRRDVDRSRVKEQLGHFMSEVTAGSLVVSGDLIDSIELRIAAIDEILSAQLSKVLHHAEFQRLESSWTGLKGLLDKSETDNTRILMLNATKAELVKDFKRPPILINRCCLKVFMKMNTVLLVVNLFQLLSVISSLITRRKICIY